MGITINDGVSLSGQIIVGPAAPSTGPQLWSWGQNNSGQLGLGDADKRSSPVQVGSDLDWASVSSASNHSIATKIDGTLWSWGAGNAGRTGHGNDTTYSIPVQIGVLADWAVAKTAKTGGIAIKTDGTLWTWGDNSPNGQIGDGTIIDRSSPVPIGAFSDWTDVSAKGDFSHAIRAGTLWAWGKNTSGYLGDGTIISKSSPVQIGSLTDWASVDNTDSRGFAIKNNGELWTWGYNGGGAFGTGVGGYLVETSPVQVPGSTWASVSAGLNHTCAIRTDGTLWTWGKAQHGKTGHGNLTNLSSPVQVGGLSDWSKVYGGTSFTIALKTDNTLWVWGRNNYGQHGVDDTVDRSSPVQIGSDTNWTSLGSDAGTVVAIKTTV